MRDGASLLERYGGVLLLLALILAFSLATPAFFSTANFIGIAQNQAIQAILSLGLLFPLACGMFDVSVSGVMTLSVVGVTALFQDTNGSFPIWAAVLVVIAAACLAGLINAFLIVRANIDPFIATIGTGSLFEGAAQAIGNGETITLHIPVSFSSFGVAKWAGVPAVIVIALVLAALAWYLLSQTPAGRLIYATGAASDAARLAGIRTRRVIASGFVLSAVGAAIAGILFAAEEGAGPPDVGTSYLLPAYATVFLGATIIRPGRFNVWGLIVAILIIAVGINGLELLGGPFWIQDLFEGGALIGAVTISRLRTSSS